MRVCKSAYTKNGKRHQAQKWYLDFSDHLGRRHRLPAFEEKRASEALASRLTDLISQRASGGEPSLELLHWIEKLSPRILRKLVEWRLIDSERAQGGRPLTEHVADWKHSLVAGGRTKEHIETVCPRVEKIVRACGFHTISDIDPVKVERYLVGLRDVGETLTLKAIDKKTKKQKTRHVKISKRTFNYAIRDTQQFCRWLVAAGRVDRNPLLALKKVSTTKADQVRTARALRLDEMRTLIQKTRSGKDYRGILGPERALIYMLGCETGLRAGELRGLRVDDFDFDGLKVTVRPEVSKNGQVAVLPLKPSTAAMIQEHVKHKLPASQAFNVPAQPHLMIKADLKTAGIDYETDEGTAYFHSLRHIYATALQMTAGNVKTAQTLMRHSDPRLTLNIYTHGIPEQERAAIEALPDLNVSAEQRKTGTDDRPVDCIAEESSAVHSASRVAEHCRTLQAAAKEAEAGFPRRAAETAISAQNQTRPARFELATDGFEVRHSIQLSYGRKPLKTVIKHANCIYVNNLCNKTSHPTRKGKGCGASHHSPHKSWRSPTLAHRDYHRPDGLSF